jgi:hypothetical protein
MVEPFNLRSVYSLLLIFPAGLGWDKKKGIMRSPFDGSLPSERRKNLVLVK